MGEGVIKVAFGCSEELRQDLWECSFVANVGVLCAARRDTLGEGLPKRRLAESVESTLRASNVAKNTLFGALAI